MSRRRRFISLVVSIHAPVKERHVGICRIRHGNCCFNSRPCEGATIIFPRCHSAQIVSIHAPVKERLAPFIDIFTLSGFNSRPCEGATQYPQVRPTVSEVSIHAPVKERRLLL